MIKVPPPGKLSAKLRSCLRCAGVERAELFTSDATRKAITFHDLRATGITWMAVRGTDALKIMQRAGHAGFATTQGYMREAENLRDGFGDVFPSLPAALLERPKSARGSFGQSFGLSASSFLRSQGFPAAISRGEWIRENLLIGGVSSTNFETIGELADPPRHGGTRGDRA